MHAFLLVGAGGALGAMARYGLGLVVGRHWHAAFPLATITANILGSLAMGVLVGLLARYTPEWQPQARLFIAVGLLGGFTTFSAFSLDSITLLERGQLGLAISYILGSVIMSIFALYGGLLLTRAVA